jgi:hypothetical protein
MVTSNNARHATTNRANGTSRHGYRTSNETNGVVARNSPGVNGRINSTLGIPIGNDGLANANNNYSNKGA